MLFLPALSVFRASTMTNQPAPPSPASEPPKRLAEFIRGAVQQYLDDMASTPPDNLYQVMITEMERPLLETVLEHTRGNQSQAAQLLGMTRATLRGRIKRYGL